MKKIIITSLISFTSLSGFCQAPVGLTANYISVPVISSTPIVVQVESISKVCQPVVKQVQKGGSGAGAIMGAIAGGAIGNSIGKGSGRALTTGLGIFGGAILGDNIEGGRRTESQSAEECYDQKTLTPQIQGYTVVYEYLGQKQTVSMPKDPGSSLLLQVSAIPVLPK